MVDIRSAEKLNLAQWLLKRTIQRQSSQLSVRGDGLSCGQRRLQPSFNLSGYRRFAKDQ